MSRRFDLCSDACSSAPYTDLCQSTTLGPSVKVSGVCQVHPSLRSGISRSQERKNNCVPVSFPSPPHPSLSSSICVCLKHLKRKLSYHVLQRVMVVIGMVTNARIVINILLKFHVSLTLAGCTVWKWWVVVDATHWTQRDSGCVWHKQKLQLMCVTLTDLTGLSFEYRLSEPIA